MSMHQRVPHREPITAARIGRVWVDLIRLVPGMTLAQMAEATGLSQGQIYKLSNRMAGRPTVEAADAWVAQRNGMKAS